ncbi:MAG: pilus assembly protein TadG-related protein [Candidatus Limnocylindria bacterium]
MVIVAGGMVVIVAMVGLVIDSGYAWSQRRSVQNAADMASMAGARVVGLHTQSGSAAGPADSDVQGAVEDVLAENGRSTTPCSVSVTEDCYTARYVDEAGVVIPGALVGGGSLPSAARGVQVEPTSQVDTFFMGVLGFSEVTTSAPATARVSGAANVGGPGDNLLPIAVVLDDELWNDHFCAPDQAASECTELHLDTEVEPGSGHNGLPGQFGWLSWDGSNSVPPLRDWIGPPANSPVYEVPHNDYIEIEGVPGSKETLRDNIRDWAALETTVIIPIVSPGPPDAGEDCNSQPDRCYPGTNTPYPESGGGTGSNAWYNIIGFAGFEITGCASGGGPNGCVRNIYGVFRQVLFNGPTGSTSGSASSPWQILATQLVD